MSTHQNAATMDRMARNKKPQGDHQTDRHKPSKMVRIPIQMMRLLEELAAEELGSSTAEQLRMAIREYLQKKGKWSKPPMP